MKYFAILSLLFEANAIGNYGGDEITRELHPGGGRGGGGGHHGGGGHDGGWKNHTHGNMTDWLNQTCTANNITCTEVSEEFLANCTDYKHHGDNDSSEDTDRELLVDVDEAYLDEDEDLLELYDMFETVDELEEEDEDEEAGELSGSADRDLKKRRHHGGGGDGGRHGGHKYGKWGNYTDEELEATKLKHLTCRCCGNHTSV
jgi:hypothetical protein